MTEDEKFEELVREETMQLTVRLPKKAEAGFEHWRKYLGFTKGAFAVLCIRVGMAHLREVLDKLQDFDKISLPPEYLLDEINSEIPDEKEY